MARLSKPDLLRLVERAIQDSGWGFLKLGARDEHPARYHVYGDLGSRRIRVYVWNVTHGGGAARSATEYRIQITGAMGPTGAGEFIAEPEGRTLILGWWDEIGVFVGFDYTRHSGPLGASPSLQVSEETLRAAHVGGFAAHNKGSGEIAIAFRPDFIGHYIENLENLHDCGVSPQVTRLLNRIGENPDDVSDDEITREVPAERQYAVVSTRRVLRDIDFRQRVLTAYGHRCAMCGIQLKLLDTAHEVGPCPVSSPIGITPPFGVILHWTILRVDRRGAGPYHGSPRREPSGPRAWSAAPTVPVRPERSEVEGRDGAASTLGEATRCTA